MVSYGVASHYIVMQCMYGGSEQVKCIGPRQHVYIGLYTEVCWDMHGTTEVQKWGILE